MKFSKGVYDSTQLRATWATSRATWATSRATWLALAGSIWLRLARSGCRDRSGWLEQGTLRAPARSGCLVLAALDAPGLDFGSRNNSIFVYFRCMHVCDGSCMQGRQNTAKTDTKRISVLPHYQQKVSENRFERYSKRFLRDERARDGGHPRRPIWRPTPPTWHPRRRAWRPRRPTWPPR